MASEKEIVRDSRSSREMVVSTGEAEGSPEASSEDHDKPPILQQQHHRRDHQLQHPEDSVKRKKPLGFHLSFLALNIITFMYALDSTTLAVAIPTIAHELNGTSLQSFWAGISFFLAVVIGQPLYTGLSDIYGRKPVLHAGFLLFGVGSLVFALTPNMTGLISGRLLQGLGGGGLDLLAEIIVADMTTLKDRPFYLGLMAIPLATGSILGPSLGAIFCQYATWRWIGWVNLPCIGVSYLLIVFFLKLQKLETSLLEKTKRMDWTGLALFIVGCLIFVLPLSWAGTLYAWRSWRTLLPLILGVLLLAAFAVYESRPAEAIVPYRLFRSRTLTVTLAAAFLHGMSLFTLLQYLPFFYQAVARKTLIQTSVSLLPTSIASIVAAALSVIVIGFSRTYRLSIWISWMFVIVGTGLLALLNEGSSKAMYYGIPVLWGIGIGALLRCLHVPMQASVATVDDTGRAIGLFLFFRVLGGLVGLAISSTIFSSAFEKSTATMGGALPEPLRFLRNPNEAIGFIPQLRTLGMAEDVLLPITHAYLHAFRMIFFIMIGFEALGLIISFLMEELSLEREELGRQQFDA